MTRYLSQIFRATSFLSSTIYHYHSSLASPRGSFIVKYIPPPVAVVVTMLLHQMLPQFSVILEPVNRVIEYT